MKQMRIATIVAAMFGCLIAQPSGAGIAAIEKPNETLLTTLMEETSWRNPESDVDHAVARLVLAEVDNESAKLVRSQKTLESQRRASVFAFYLAHSLLLLGISLGLLEFRQAYRLRRTGRQSDRIELSISLEGIALKSSVNGLLLFLLSFAFYLAFLHYVYPLGSL